MPHRNLAAVDMGTNSFHLVVARVDEKGRFEVIGREKESVRLGSGAGDLDSITPEAMQRGLEALNRFCVISKSYGAELRAVATSAVREAKNQKEFLQRVKKECDLKVEVIPGIEEARLIYLGILQALPLYEKQILTMDIGGGSTEYLIGKEGIPKMAVSLKLGAIRLKDRFFADEPLSKSQVQECRNFIRSMLDPVAREVKQIGFQVAVGSSGTIETLLEMIHGEENPNRPKHIQLADLDEIVKRILSFETAKKRAVIPGLDDKRSDIIVGGAILLQESFQALGIETMQVSPYALREGALYDAVVRKYRIRSPLNDIRHTSVRHLYETFQRKDESQMESEHIATLSVLILRRLRESGFVTEMGIDEEKLLEYGALLHNVGMVISHSSHHKHGYYIIKNTDLLLGFQPDEIEILAMLARYHRKALPSKKHPEFDALSQSIQWKIKVLASILKISIGLERDRHKKIQNVIVEKHKSKIVFSITGKHDLTLNLWAAKEKSDLFEKTFDIEVVFAKK